MDSAEIVIYKGDKNSGFQLEVIVEDETVWLTQSQLVELFSATKQNISLHINNIFKEGELDPAATVKESLTVQTEGKRKVKRKILYYNLDIIISVGYRVKSPRGTQFRIWANEILKEYLLKGYALPHRVERIEKKLLEHDQKFDLLIRSSLRPLEGIFYDGQVFDACEFVSGIIKSAQKSIVLIDNYIDETVLALLAKRQANVSAKIFTAKISRPLELDLERHNKQNPAITLYTFTKAHDRFLIIDDETVYHIGASIKDLGKKWFAFSKINLDAREILNHLKSQ